MKNVVNCNLKNYYYHLYRYCNKCYSIKFALKCPLNHDLVEKDLKFNICDSCNLEIIGKGYRD